LLDGPAEPSRSATIHLRASELVIWPALSVLAEPLTAISSDLDAQAADRR